MPEVDARSAAPAPQLATPETEVPGPEAPVALGRRLLNARTVLSFAVGIGILVAFVRTANVDAQRIWQHLSQVDPALYAYAVLSYLCTFPVRGMRWRLLLGNVGYRMATPLLTEVILLSWFVNSVLPAKMGDLYRGWLLKKARGVSMSHAIGTVLAERIIDASALVLLLAVSGLFALRGRVSPEMASMLELGLVGLLMIGLGLLLMARLGAHVSRLFSLRVQGVYARFEEGTFRSFRGMPVVVVLTALAWAAEVGRLYFVTQALGLNVGLVVAIFVLSAGSLLLVVPTPGGLGAVETGIAGVLALVGVGAEAALAAAILDRLISYWGLILVGVPVYLFSRLTK